MSKLAPFTLLAALLGPVAALAASDVPGNSGTQAVLPFANSFTGGTFNSNSDSDWYRIKLTQGADVALTFNHSQYLEDGANRSYGALRDPSGKLIKQVYASPNTQVGFEYKVPATATYFVEAKLVNRLPTDTPDYAIRLGSDCAAKTSTTCALNLGRQQQRAYNFPTDHDWYKVKLAKSRSYTVTATAPDAMHVDLRDAAGKLLKKDIKTFKAPASGTFFLDVTSEQEDGDETYTIVIK